LAYEKQFETKSGIGTYRFARIIILFSIGKDIKLKREKTFWGGEPAGDILY